MAAVALLFTACNDDLQAPNQEEQQIDMSDFYVYTSVDDDVTSKQSNGKSNEKSCFTMNNLNRMLQDNPGLEKKMYDIEYQTRKFLATKATNGKGKPGGNNGGDTDVDVAPIKDGLGVINIPVYVHVIYNSDSENISEAQIQSQIDVLNADFRALNKDLNLPLETTFENDVTDAEFHFTLAGINRKHNTTTSWTSRETMKYSSQGGIDAVTPETHLNIWVVNKMVFGGRTILGYAQFPGGASETDGVVIAHNYFGDTGIVSAPFNLGRTATHEVGHWLNLRHIWGDGRCRQDDFVADTPSSDGPNYGCPGYPTVNCQSIDMTMNYMDYTNDECMYMFTDGQRNRMRAIFLPGGARASMLN